MNLTKTTRAFLSLMLVVVFIAGQFKISVTPVVDVYFDSGPIFGTESNDYILLPSGKKIRPNFDDDDNDEFGTTISVRGFDEVNVHREIADAFIYESWDEHIPAKKEVSYSLNPLLLFRGGHLLEKSLSRRKGSVIITHAIGHSEKLVEDIRSIQQKNLKKNLGDKAYSDGYLMAQMTSKNLDSYLSKHGAIIAFDFNKMHLAGYALFTDNETASSLEIFKPIFKRFDHLFYNGKNLSKWKSFTFIQACVDKNYRGTGIIYKLNEVLKDYARSYGYQIAHGLIAKDNSRSLNVHVNKIGATVIGKIRSLETDWNIVVFDYT